MRLAAAFNGGFRAEIILLGRSHTLLALTALQAVAFLVLVSLFALTGSRAPVAVVLEDHGAYARMFADELRTTHHSFAVKLVTQQQAAAELRRGRIVAILTIPAGFSDAVLFGRDSRVTVDLDNIDTDMTDDVHRALPAAIVAFGRRLRLPQVRIRVVESDLIGHDTGFMPYLAVSGLILDAFVIAGVLTAMTVAREFESGSIRVLATAPAPTLVPVLGRAAASTIAACGVLLLPLGIVVYAYGVHPIHPVSAALVLFICTTIFSCFGVVVGAVMKRTLPVAALMLGLAMPLYLCSGSLEPARFDGNRVWIAAHFSPVYYAVGLLEDAFHGLHVTPESLTADGGALAVWCAGMLLTAAMLLRRQTR